MNDTKQFEKDAAAVSAVGILGNLVLTLFKIVAGVAAHSSVPLKSRSSASSMAFSITCVVVMPSKRRSRDTT